MNEMPPHLRRELEARELYNQQLSDQAWDECVKYYDEHPDKKRPEYLYHRYDPDYWKIKPCWKSFLQSAVFFLTGILIFPNLWEDQHPQYQRERP